MGKGFEPRRRNGKLLILRLTLVTYLSKKSMLKSLMMATVGLLLACIGLDPIFGIERFTFGSQILSDGMDVAIMCMGLFGIAEVLSMAEASSEQADFMKQHPTKLRDLLPNKQDWKDSSGPIIRGSILGFFLGLLPGGGGLISSFTSYAIEKKVSKHPEKFGTGAIEGVAGPETANNAHANGALIPLFTLGIPASPTVAVIMGAFMMHGLIPGPFLFKEHPDVVWGVIASFYVGNVILLILNLPLVGIWVKILKIPYGLLFGVILAFMIVGAYSVSNSTFDVLVMTLFGVIGYLLRKMDFPLAPVVLTLILGPLMERSLRQSLEMSQGDLRIFLESPIAVVLLALAGLTLIAPAFKFFRKKKEVLSGEEGV